MTPCYDHGRVGIQPTADSASCLCACTAVAATRRRRLFDRLCLVESRMLMISIIRAHTFPSLVRRFRLEHRGRVADLADPNAVYCPFGAMIDAGQGAPCGSSPVSNRSGQSQGTTRRVDLRFASNRGPTSASWTSLCDVFAKT